MCWGLITLVLCGCVSFTAATLLQCNPVEGAYNHWDGHYSCVNIYALWYSNAIYSILTDFIIVLMVPPVIFKLKLPMRQKLALTCIFGLGIIVCAASISRLTTLYSSAYGSDATAGTLISTIWTCIEAGLGIICANLPMLRTPLQRFFPRIFPTRAGTNELSSTCTSRPSGVGTGRTLVMPATVDQNPLPPPASSLFYPSHMTSSTPVQPTIDKNKAWDEHILRPTRAAISNSHNDYEAQERHDYLFGRGGKNDTCEQDWYHDQHEVW